MVSTVVFFRYVVTVFISVHLSDIAVDGTVVLLTVTIV